MELNISQRLDFDPSKLQIPGIHAEAIYQFRTTDFKSFPVGLIISHLEFAFLYQNSYLNQFLQVLQSLSRNTEFKGHLPYWTNFMNSFNAEGMNFLDEQSTNIEFLNEINVLLLACGVEIKTDRLNIFNSSLILARKFLFTVEIINSQGRSIMMNSITTEMNIPVLLHDENCSIVYLVQKFYNKGIRDISKIPDRNYLTLACGHEVDQENIESCRKLLKNKTCSVCQRNLYDKEKQIIEELTKILERFEMEKRPKKAKTGIFKFCGCSCSLL